MTTHTVDFDRFTVTSATAASNVRTIVNRFPGRCFVCQQDIEAGAGFATIGGIESWTTHHALGTCTVPEVPQLVAGGAKFPRHSPEGRAHNLAWNALVDYRMRVVKTARVLAVFGQNNAAALAAYDEADAALDAA
ncbi:hypothetical protein [uncultured Friedmanniella sp.]|uniref:hypothetical protein n=1 Tax=uncultured Friedmanniella sp. TaxID=335381 RepID=UPI0035CA9042